MFLFLSLLPLIRNIRNIAKWDWCGWVKDPASLTEKRFDFKCYFFVAVFFFNINQTFSCFFFCLASIILKSS